jgi:hypothetical protein
MRSGPRMQGRLGPRVRTGGRGRFDDRENVCPRLGPSSERLGVGRRPPRLFRARRRSREPTVRLARPWSGSPRERPGAPPNGPGCRRVLGTPLPGVEQFLHNNQRQFSNGAAATKRGSTFRRVLADPDSSEFVSFVSELIEVETDHSTGRVFAMRDPRPQNGRGGR